MTRAKLLGAVLLASSGAGVAPAPARAQATVGADLGIFSSYVWRGVSLTNRPVAQPDLYLTIPVGGAAVTLGGWANVDLGRYDGTDDFSESGGVSSFNFAEFDPWAEINVPAGRATFTGGVLGYVFPNDGGVFTSAANTVELYAKAGLAVPLNPKVAAWYDVDNIKGLYAEASVSQALPLTEAVGVTLGALAGFNAGEGIPDDPTTQSANFADDGFTHLDLSAAVPFTAGMFSLAPALHVVINGDQATKFTQPDATNDVKLWFGGTISWSRALGQTPAETVESGPGGQ